MSIIFIIFIVLGIVAQLARPRDRIVIYREPDYVVPLRHGQDTPARVAESHFIAINEHIEHAQAASLKSVRQYHALKAQAILDQLRQETQHMPFKVDGIDAAQTAINHLIG
ncbi:hypothetical protein [Chromobacterium sp. IIBBL 290-4]|uniref:hypothetical protein n=1 Tax=Chromobacterium sp. IIBBL 290-4 TaxID=2953890 RepID=UPI0020B7791A|nr:hypothetical protein [Chromobacterium sp. IIBBL 290-4]UTH72499.1 hypothetical protein NKT35_13160 [Chromobacterium sp. IIBBL 290-4]